MPIAVRAIVCCALPLWIASCGAGESEQTLERLCSSEMAVAPAPPDSAARMRVIERSLLLMLRARGSLPWRPMLEAVRAWQRPQGDSVSYSDALTALVLLGLRGLYNAPYLAGVIDTLGEQRDGPERVWSLLSVPPAECVLQNCSLFLVIQATTGVARPRGQTVPESYFSPWYRGGFCRLLAVYSDSTWPTRHPDALELANERNGAAAIGYRLLQRLARTGSKSDAEFVRMAVRAARASGDLGRGIADAYDEAMNRRGRR